jgi:hypothetical protein
VALFSDAVGAGAPPATVEFKVDEAVRSALRSTTDTLELGFMPIDPDRSRSADVTGPAAVMGVGEASAH